MEIAIRPASSRDAAALTALVRQLGYELTTGDAEERLERLAANRDHAIFVAVTADQVIGFMHLSLIEGFEHETRCEIRALSVDQQHRGAGAGALLVEAAERWTRDRGLRQLRVRSNVVRERARRFYERLGYVVTKSQHVFDKQLRGESGIPDRGAGA